MNIEKTLNGILQHLNNEETKPEKEINSVHDHQTQITTPVSGSLDFIIEQSVTKWLDSNWEKLEPIIQKCIDKKINIPDEYIKDHLKTKLSSDNIQTLFHKTLKSVL